jgi:hypothetical protein
LPASLPWIALLPVAAEPFAAGQAAANVPVKQTRSR